VLNNREWLSFLEPGLQCFDACLLPGFFLLAGLSLGVTVVYLSPTRLAFGIQVTFLSLADFVLGVKVVLC
jgi:hypothetical protein